MVVSGCVLYLWGLLYVYKLILDRLGTITDRHVTVSVHGGGYHLWEVTKDELVRYMKVRIQNL